MFAAFAQQKEMAALPVAICSSAPERFGAGQRLRVAAVAATVLICSVLTLALWWRTQQPEQESNPARAPAPQLNHTTTEAAEKQPGATPLKNESEPAVQIASRSSVRHRPLRRMKPVQRAEESYGELFTLKPITPTEPTEFEHIVRMQIPRTALALWGVQSTRNWSTIEDHG